MTASVSESSVSFEAVRLEVDTKVNLRLVDMESSVHSEPVSKTASADRPPNADRVSNWLSTRGRKHFDAPAVESASRG